MIADITEPRNQRDVTWVTFERPVGRVPLPAWVKDVHVNWMEGFSNGPDYWMYVTHDIGDWPGKTWRKEGKFYRAYHPDGYVDQHAHDGRVSMTRLKAWRNPDGTLSQYRGQDGGEWVEGDFPATSQQEGYAGRHFWLKMEDGTDLVLRGPWWGGKPQGYEAASIVTPIQDVAYQGKAPGTSAAHPRSGCCLSTYLSPRSSLGFSPTCRSCW